jgi:hypothetical protein
MGGGGMSLLVYGIGPHEDILSVSNEKAADRDAMVKPKPCPDALDRDVGAIGQSRA